jgi:hypothetical protein
MTTEAQRRLYQGPRAHKAKWEITPGVVRTAFSWRPLSRSVCERCQQKLAHARSLRRLAVIDLSESEACFFRFGCASAWIKAV